MSFWTRCSQFLLLFLFASVALLKADMLTYRDAVINTLNNSARIKVKVEDTNISEADYRRNLGALYPQISINGRFENSENLDEGANQGMNTISGEVVGGVSDPWRSSTYLLGQYDISNWYKKRYEVAYYEKLRDASTYECDIEVRKLLAELTDIFSAAAEGKIRLKCATDTLKLLRDVLDLKKQAFAKGQEPYEEVLKFEAEIADSEKEISSISKDLKENLERLFSYMGKTHDDGVEIEAFVFDSMQQVAEFPKFIENTPAYKARVMELEALKLKAKAAGNNYWPDISLYARYDYYGSDPDHFDRSMEDMRETAYTVGLLINLTLFDGGVRKWERKKSRYELKRQAESIKAVMEEESRGVRTLRAGYAELSKSLKHYRKLSEQYAKMIDITKKARGFGERSMVDILELEKEALTVERDLKITEHALVVYEKRLMLEADYNHFISEHYGNWTCKH